MPAPGGGPGPSPSPSPNFTLSESALDTVPQQRVTSLWLLPRPPRASCPGRQQVAEPARHRCSLAGDAGWSGRFLPRPRFPQLPVHRPCLGGRLGGGRQQTQPRAAGMSKHRFLPPPSAASAASAAVASGWLTMLAGAGALRLGRVTSLNCPRRQLPLPPYAHLAGLPACLEMGRVPGEA